jgi:hypothetical protein
MAASVVCGLMKELDGSKDVKDNLELSNLLLNKLVLANNPARGMQDSLSCELTTKSGQMWFLINNVQTSG